MGVKQTPDKGQKTRYFGPSVNVIYIVDELEKKFDEKDFHWIPFVNGIYGTFTYQQRTNSNRPLIPEFNDNKTFVQNVITTQVQ